MAIEVRSFEGDATELAAFVSRNWQIQYRDDGYAPVLNPRYFEWMMPTFASGDASNIIAAYEGRTLVGVMPSDPLPMTLMGQPIMTLGREYLTVDSGRLRGGIGRLLREGLGARCREIGARFAVGFVNARGMAGKGRSFWNSMAAERVVINRPSQWIRILDGVKASAAIHDRFERVSAWACGVYGSPLAKGIRTGHVRPYKDSDLPACHNLFLTHMRDYDLAYRWDDKRLQHHLGFPGLPTTLVCEESDGGLAGFAVCYVFDLVGRHSMRNAIIDIFIPKTKKLSQKIGLLLAAVDAARAQDAHLVVALGPPVNSAAALFAGRFVPVPMSYRLLLAVFEAAPALKDVRRSFAIFR